MRLRQLINDSPYVGYTYSYPHKTAYGTLAPPVSLSKLWAGEKRDSLFLYLHVPFCEMRCGFCNLFTTANPNPDLMRSYVTAVHREAQRVRTALGSAAFSRMAMGGGTPTFLSHAELESLLDIAKTEFGIDSSVPSSVETSPRTAELAKLQMLRAKGVTRISIGVQSFVDSEVAGAGRAQKSIWVEQAISRIRQAGFAILNVDLIYGLQGQSVASWLTSLEAALQFSPEELYLYPLYVRPLTGLDRWGASWDDVRLQCYRAGRDLLLSRGYQQLSMRMFRSTAAPDLDGPVYCCQDDGMVGIGCGARSYTSALHYSNEFAVGAAGVREIISDYVARPAERFDCADYGASLDDFEQKRRWVIKTLLRIDGLHLPDYKDRFSSSLLKDFAELNDLEESGLAENDGTALKLTAGGIERSDAIGPWLYSAATQERMEAFELR